MAAVQAGELGLGWAVEPQSQPAKEFEHEIAKRNRFECGIGGEQLGSRRDTCVRWRRLHW